MKPNQPNITILLLIFAERLVGWANFKKKQFNLLLFSKSYPKGVVFQETHESILELREAIPVFQGS